ncbi:MAG TPA: HAD-IA family hydrolase [Ktedonobacteraceae bacterium]|nr:HAD-IA family hydrolase [Ktedonobacteraceae bacterium]
MDSRYQALIFDLFGTLVDVFSMNAHDAAIVAMADILQLPLSDFSLLWGEGTYTQRSNGTFTSIEENLAYICRHLKIAPDEQRIQQAANVRYEFTRAALKPKPDALKLLTLLKQKGYRTGLISNCAPDVPRLWQTTPLAELIDVPVFSCEIKIKKPDPRIYRLACERLRVAPQACLYVGDGSDHELTGAKKVGLSPVLVLTSLVDAYDAQRLDVDGWKGRIIQSLTDILTQL